MGEQHETKHNHDDPLETLQRIRKQLKKELDTNRYRHTIGVMDTAACLAMAYGLDLYPAQLAGLLHDCAKCISTERKFKLCKKYGVKLSEAEIANPKLIHASLGAELAARKYNVSDREIRNAIRWHTTGRPGMSMLEKIIYTADYIEPNRVPLPNITLVRKLAFSNIDEAIYVITRDSLTYLNQRGDTVDSMTEATYHYYSNLLNNKSSKD